jgi:hypothetical protein
MQHYRAVRTTKICTLTVEYSGYQNDLSITEAFARHDALWTSMSDGGCMIAGLRDCDNVLAL